MSELLKEDLMWCVRRLPKCVRDMLKNEGEKLFVAGGFIRACVANEKPADVDLFCPTKDMAELYARRMGGRMVTTDNAHTVLGVASLPIQFIHKWTFDKPADVIPSFDFTIAKAIIWWGGEKWQSICDARFYQDLASKRLTYCSPVRVEEVGGSLLRVLKFYQRGYRIPLDSLGAVIARLISGLDNKKSDLSTEGNVAEVLTGLLREVDPQVDPSHESHR